MKKDFAFEQVRCKYPAVKEAVKEMAEESDRWIITWPHDSRETGMVGLAWYAREFDDEAVVSPASDSSKEKPNESDDSAVTPA